MLHPSPPPLLMQTTTPMVMGKAKVWIPLLVTMATLVSRISVAAYQDDKATPKKNYAQEYYQSFKGKPDNTEALVFKGPDAQEHVKYEPGGLRITLPPGHPDQRQGTGLALVSPVKGDFEITMSFEILKEPDPIDAGKKYGTRVSLGAYLDTPEKNEVSLSRRIDNNGVTQFVTYFFMAKYGPGATPKPRYLPTAAKTGRLRLVRTESVVACYASEGANGEFIFLKEYPFSALLLKSVYITMSTGGPQAALDVRVTDFRIRADSLPDLPGAALIAAPVAVPIEEGPPAKPRPWLLAGLVLGGVLLTFLGLALGAWLFVRQRRPVAQTSAPSSIKGEQANPETAASPVVFRCSACGKRLKATPELAGKKIKCSACGKAVLVPEKS